MKPLKQNNTFLKSQTVSKCYYNQGSYIDMLSSIPAIMDNDHEIKD